jgi:hypothetical protein
MWIIFSIPLCHCLRVCATAARCRRRCTATRPCVLRWSPPSPPRRRSPSPMPLPLLPVTYRYFPLLNTGGALFHPRREEVPARCHYQCIPAGPGGQGLFIRALCVQPAQAAVEVPARADASHRPRPHGMITVFTLYIPMYTYVCLCMPIHTYSYLCMPIYPPPTVSNLCIKPTPSIWKTPIKPTGSDLHRGHLSPRLSR